MVLALIGALLLAPALAQGEKPLRLITGELGTTSRGQHLRYELRQEQYHTEGPILRLLSNKWVVKETNLGIRLHLMDALGAVVAKRDGAWFLFFEITPGVGSTWYTAVIRIDRKTLVTSAVQNPDEPTFPPNFEHGDGSRFSRTGLFFEYRYAKYQGRPDMLDKGLLHLRVAWAWDPRAKKFVKGNSKWVPEVSNYMIVHGFNK